MESVLRPYDLGSTQWYVLYQLANDGPTMQRDLGHMLQIETLSGIVATLVRKGLVDQMPGSEDQRQRVLRITDAGMKLWEELPDPLAVIRAIVFDGSKPVPRWEKIRAPARRLPYGRPGSGADGITPNNPAPRRSVKTLSRYTSKVRMSYRPPTPSRDSARTPPPTRAGKIPRPAWAAPARRAAGAPACTAGRTLRRRRAPRSGGWPPRTTAGPTAGCPPCGSGSRWPQVRKRAGTRHRYHRPVRVPLRLDRVPGRAHLALQQYYVQGLMSGAVKG
jgi:DNA-binding MarR family transcriptional regulator